MTGPTNRLNVNLAPDDVANLKKLMTKSGDSQTEAVRKALRLAVYTHDIAGGSVIFVRGTDGRLRELVIL